MPHFRVAALAVALLATPALATTTVVPAADFDLTDHEGEVVILDFWAGWCKPCLKALPWLSDQQARHGADGLTVIAVNLDRPADVPDDVIGSLHDRVVVVLDPDRDVSRPYRLRGLPTTILLDQEGNVRARRTGHDPSTHADWERRVARLLADRRDATASAPTDDYPDRDAPKPPGPTPRHAKPPRPCATPLPC